MSPIRGIRTAIPPASRDTAVRRSHRAGHLDGPPRIVRLRRGTAARALRHMSCGT
jgi:hypothetical protein